MKITLITGGARSGKSRHALELESAGRYDSAAFIATSVPSDEEMKQRIEKHKKERGESLSTIEEPVDLAGAVASISVQVAVIDCLTTWLGNLMHDNPGRESFPEIDGFLKALEAPPCDLIIVTNEVGMGIVPDNPMARRFRDIAGNVNQKVAAAADEVILMVSGIATTIKGEK